MSKTWYEIKPSFGHYYHWKVVRYSRSKHGAVYSILRYFKDKKKAEKYLKKLERKDIDIDKKVVKIKIEKLREIADYYNFPLAVFFSPIGTLKGTRQEKYAKAYEKLNKIKEILEED